MHGLTSSRLVATACILEMLCSRLIIQREEAGIPTEAARITLLAA